MTNLHANPSGAAAVEEDTRVPTRTGPSTSTVTGWHEPLHDSGSYSCGVDPGSSNQRNPLHGRGDRSRSAELVMTIGRVEDLCSGGGFTVLARGWHRLLDLPLWNQAAATCGPTCGPAGDLVSATTGGNT